MKTLDTIRPGTAKGVLALISCLAFAATAAAAPSAVATLPTGKEVLTRFIEASGGEAAMAKVKNVVTKATLSMKAQGLTGKITSYETDGKMLSHVQIEGIGQVETGYDGKIGWSKDPMQGPRVLSEKELAMMKLTEAKSVKDLESVIETIEVKSRTTFEGKDAYEVRLVLKAAAFECLAYFDVATGLMIGMKAEQDTPLGKLPVTIVMTDHQSFGGLKVPKTVINRMTVGQGMEQVVTIDSVEFNVADFPVIQAPADIVALAGRAPAAAVVPPTN